MVDRESGMVNRKSGIVDFMTSLMVTTHGISRHYAAYDMIGMGGYLLFDYLPNSLAYVVFLLGGALFINKFFNPKNPQPKHNNIKERAKDPIVGEIPLGLGSTIMQNYGK
jgi:hypothetical protein